MAAEGGVADDSDGACRRPGAVPGHRTILLIAVASALVHHADAGFSRVPHVDAGGDWIGRGISRDVKWSVVGPALTGGRPPGTAVSQWNQLANTWRPRRRRRRTELEPDGRFVATSKRRSAYTYVYMGHGTRSPCVKLINRKLQPCST